MAGKKNQFNLSKEQISAAAKAGREKTEKVYAEKADVIAQGYSTNKKTTSASNTNATKSAGKKNQFGDVSKALAANNPGYAYLKATGAKTGGITKGSDANVSGMSANEKKGIAANNPGYAYLNNSEKDQTVSKSTYAGNTDWYKKILRGIDTGLTNAGYAITSAAEAVGSLGDSEGGPLQELWYMLGGDKISKDNPLKTLKNTGEEEVNYRAEKNAAIQDDPLYKYSAMATESGAMLVPTLMSGGATAATGTTAALTSAANYAQAGTKATQIGALAKRAVSQVASRADAKYIFASTAGSSYNEAKQSGADDLQATVYALINGANNAVSELGGVADLGGLQKLIGKKGEGNQLLNYVMSVGEEILEEIYQGATGRAFTSIYQNVPLYSTTNDDAIFNPNTALDEATGAAVVTTLLGIPTAGVNAYYKTKQNNAIKNVYGADAQSLVNAGLEAEEGTTAHNLAEQAQQKLDNGKTLSAKELRELVQANEETFGAETTSQSIPELAETANSAPFIPYSNTAKTNIAQNIASQSRPSFSDTINALGTGKALTETAEKHGVSAELVERVYNLNPEADTTAFSAAFDAAVQMGQENANEKALDSVPVLSGQQAKIAYAIGQSKAERAKTIQKTGNTTVDNVISKAQSGGISLSDVRPILADKTALNALQRLTGNINLKGKDSSAQRVAVRDAITNYVKERSNNEVHLRDSGERSGSQDTGGQVRKVEEVSGLDTGRRGSQKQGGNSTAQSKGEKVIFGGVAQKAVYSTVETEEMKKGREAAAEKGYTVRYFEGASIRLPDGGYARGIIDTVNKVIYVRSDHPYLTPEQIINHEFGHAAIDRGEISLDDARAWLKEKFTDAEIDTMIREYREAYKTDEDEYIYDEDEAFEEIICDALGGINIFENTTHDTETYHELFDEIRAYSVESKSNSTRGPPRESGTMHSRGVNGKQIVWIENNPLSLKDLTNYKKVAAYIAEHVGEAYTIIESGYKVYIGESLPNEYTQSKYTMALLKKNRKTLTAKNKAVGSFGEMIEIATNRRWEKAKHSTNKDAKYGVYRYSTTFAFPVKQNGEVVNVKSFDAELIILNSSNGKKYLYDIVNIKENTADGLDLMNKGQMGRQRASARRSVSENNIAENNDGVKTSLEQESDYDGMNGVMFSREQDAIRKKPAPKNVQWGFKLMNVDKNGLPHAMFIDSAAAFQLNTWYDASAPNMPDLEKLEPGYAYLVDADGNADIATRKTVEKTKNGFKKLPGKVAINDATADGKRWMVVSENAKGERKYHNVGINGSGTVSVYALRPGLHAVDIPSMRHIGAQSNGVIDRRRPDQRWFLIEYPVDVDYNQEAYANDSKDIQDHLPTDGWYSFQTNSGAEKHQHWFITGAMKIVGAVSEQDARAYAKQQGFEADLEWKDGKSYDDSKGAIDLMAYAAEHADTKTPSKDEMRRRIEAERDGKASAVVTKKEHVITLDDDYKGDISPESGSLRFSLEENENIKAKSMAYFRKNRDDISHISQKQLESANEIVDEMVDYMKPYLDKANNKGKRYLPEEILGDTRFQNGSYGRTIENTTICFRTLAYIDFTNDIKERIGRPLTVEESFLASQMLYDIAKEPQCLYCYVSLDRKAYDEFLLKYIEQRDGIVKKINALNSEEKDAAFERVEKYEAFRDRVFEKHNAKEYKTDKERNAAIKKEIEAYIKKGVKTDDMFKSFLAGRKPTQNMQERYNSWVKYAVRGDNLIGAADLTTEEKRSKIKADGGVMSEQVADAESYAQSASWAKKLEQYRAYNGEILSMSNDMVETLNSEYGLRFYSFSEYTPAFIVENMQQIRDASLKGFKGLAYTKKPDFARIFAPTGMNINISVFGRMDGGKVVPDTLQGADWAEVQELRKQYDNVGAVFVATTDEMVDWALEQDWIDVVIPFHIVRTGANVAEFYKWINHTSQQSDRVRKSNGTGGKKADITPPEHNNDYETYKKLIEKRKLVPRFEKWYKDPRFEGAKYMKLVNETRQPASKTPKLKPNFDKSTLEAAKKSFSTFVDEGGYYGDWYEEGVDYNEAVNTVVNDINRGVRANEVEYGRQDVDWTKAMENRGKNRQHGQKLSREVTAVDLSDISVLSEKIGDATGAKKYNIIRNFILDELSQQPVVLSDGRKAVVDRSDALHIANKSHSKKTAEISQIRRIVETAQLVAEEASTKNGKFNHFYYYEAPVRYRGETFNVYLNVGVAKNDATNHIYDITQKLRDTAQPVAVGRLSKSFALGSGISDKSIYNASENVKEHYSREPETLNELRRQNRMLRERVDYWKGQTKPAKEKTLNKNDVHKLAMRLKEIEPTDLKTSEIEIRLNQLGRYILNTKEIRFTDVAEMAEDLAWDIVDNMSVKTEAPELELHNDIKSYMQSIVMHDDGSSEYRDIRRRYKNKRYFRFDTNKKRFEKSSLGVDSVYGELQTIYGEGLFPSDIWNVYDQLERIAEVLDRTKGSYVDKNNPEYQERQYYAADAVEMLRNSIIDGMLSEDVRQTAPTYAEKAEAKLAKQKYEDSQKLKQAKAEGKQKLAEQKSEYDKLLEAQRKELNDRREQEVKDVRDAKDEQIARIRKARDEKITRLIDENDERIKAALKKERKRSARVLREYRQRVENRDAKREENAERAKYKKRIEQDVKALSDWLLKPGHKNAVKHIPGPLQETVKEFIGSIEFTSKRVLKGGAATKADMKYISKLEKLYNYVTDQNVSGERYSGYLDLPPTFENDLNLYIARVNSLARANNGIYTINQMTADELEQLSKIVKTIRKAITDMNKFYQNAVFQHAYEAGASDVQTLKKYAKTKAFTSSLATSRLDQTVMWKQSRPVHVFSRFGEGGKSICQEFIDGQNKFAFLMKETIDFANETYTSKEAQKWGKESHTFEFGDENNPEYVTLTTPQIMSLYMLNQRDAGRQHLETGGLIGATHKGKGGKLVQDSGTHKLGQAEIHEICLKLAELDLQDGGKRVEVAEKLQKFMAETGGEWGNWVSVKRFDVEMSKDKNYFPIEVYNAELNTSEVKANDSTNLYQLLNMGFTKELSPKANQAVVISSIFDVFANHMSQMAQYRCFALPVLDTMKWLNYSERNASGEVVASLKNEMRRAFGTDAQNNGVAEHFITHFVQAVSGTEGRGDNSVNARTLNRVNRAAVAYNTRVMIQQPSAVVRAALYLNPVDLAAAMKNYTWVAARKNIEEMRKYSGIAVWKDLGFYDVNVSRGLQEMIKHDQDVISKANEVGMKGAELMDRLTWAAIWEASKKKVSRETDLTGEEYYKKVAEVFDEVIYNTQVVDSPLTKSEFSRDKSFANRLFASFMSEPMTTMSLVTSEIFNIQMKQAAGEKLKASDYKRLSQTITVVAIAAVINSALAAIIDAWRDDDDYATFKEKWLAAWKAKLVDELNPLTYFPIASTAWDFAKSLMDTADMKFLGVEVYGNNTDIPIADIFDQTNKALEIFMDIKEKGEESKYTKYGGYYKVVSILSKVSGIPAYNIMREISDVNNNLFPEHKWLTYDAGETSNIKYAFEDGYLTEDEAIEALQNIEDEGERLDANEAWIEVNKWKSGESGTTSDYVSVYDAIDNDGDIRGAVKDMQDHGKEDKDIKSALTRRYKDAYIAGDATERAKIRKALYATGLYDSANDVVKKCNDWLKDDED